MTREATRQAHETDPRVVVSQRRRATAEQIGHARITEIVDVFYNRIQTHPTLAEPFRIVADWSEHKARLTHFWWVSLGGQVYADYQYAVAPKHAEIGVTAALVDDWLTLFETTMLEYIPVDLAEQWLTRARHMGNSIRMIGDFYRRKAQRPEGWEGEHRG